MIRTRPLTSRNSSFAGSPATKIMSRVTKSFGRAAAKTWLKARFGRSAKSSDIFTVEYRLVVKFIGSTGNAWSCPTEDFRLTPKLCGYLTHKKELPYVRKSQICKPSVRRL